MTPVECRVAVLDFKELGGQPEDVASIDHRFISGPTADLPVRIYRPVLGGTGPMPGLVYFHGGGWVEMGSNLTTTTSKAEGFYGLKGTLNYLAKGVEIDPILPRNNV